MTSVNEYLKKLLYQYDCVVVPELGAFLTHYQPATYTEASGLYLPPRKRIAFNEALRLDDGILANYIMLHESVARDVAQRHIATFVNELHQQIDTGGRFELENIGTFTNNDENRLQFHPSIRHNFFGEAYGMTPLATQRVNPKPIQEPAIDAVPVTTALGPVLVRDEDVVHTPLQPSIPYWRIAAAVLLIGTVGVVSYFSVIKPDQPFQSSLDPSNLFHSTSAYFGKSAEEKTVAKPEKTKELAPVVTAATKPEVTKIAPVDVKPVNNDGWTEVAKSTPEVEKTAPVVVDVKSAPVVAAKAVPTEVKSAPVVVKTAPAAVAPVVAKTTPTVVKSAPTVAKAAPVAVKPASVPEVKHVAAASIEVKAKPVVATKKVAIAAVKAQRVYPNFLAIAGVFSSKQNAYRLKSQLRQAGFADAFVITPKRGQKQLFKVSAMGSNTREDVIAKMPEINDLTGADSWIFDNF